MQFFSLIKVSSFNIMEKERRDRNEIWLSICENEKRDLHNLRNETVKR